MSQLDAATLAALLETFFEESFEGLERAETSLLAQQQVVIKSLETNFGRVDGLAGATILGDGRVAFILDIAALSRDIRHAA